jgi:NADPH-dependent 7-cyano-7-deazaguanine reductase QueF-like protein
MNTVIYRLLSVDSAFLFQVRVKTRLDIVENGLPAGESKIHENSWYMTTCLPAVIVHEITEARSVNDSETKSYATFFNVYDQLLNERAKRIACVFPTGTDALNSNSLGALCTRRNGLFGRIERSVKESVD